jgi:hypothetical protein
VHTNSFSGLPGSNDNEYLHPYFRWRVKPSRALYVLRTRLCNIYSQCLSQDEACFITAIDYVRSRACHRPREALYLGRCLCPSSAMPETPCHPLSEQRYNTPHDWDKFYESGMPDILYRVHATDSCTRYSPTEGFLPTGTCPDGVASHCDAINHSLSYRLRLPSPFVWMSFSFIYVLWEALRRNQRLHIPQSKIQIWFIDTVSLKRCRPVRSSLFHAVELIQKCEGSCTAQAEHHTTALDFASVFDEVLVLGGVPTEAIIGCVSLPELLPLLPPYFFTQEPNGSPVLGDCLVYNTPERLALRDGYTQLKRNVPPVDAVRNAFEHVDLALRLAHRVSRDVSVPESDVRDLLRRLASATVNWLIRWEDTMIPAFDNRWACPGSVWITEYLNHRISKDPVPRHKLKVRL